MQESVYGANYNEPGFGKKAATTSQKRSAPDDDPALQEAAAKHDFKVGFPRASIHKFHFGPLHTVY